MHMFPDEQDVAVQFNTAFHASSAGETLKMLSDSSLTGKVCQVVLINPSGLRSILPVTAVDISGTFAYLTTSATTFQFSGSYQVMLQEVNGTAPNQTFTDATPFIVNVLATI